MEKQFSKIFSILSDVNRLNIYSYLLYRPEGLYVCELSSILELPPYTISKSLKELESVDLIESQRYGKYILYLPIKSQNELILKLNSLVYDIASASNMIDKAKIDKVVNNRSQIQCQCDIKKEE
ncbi:MAG: winged helix-turn-helix transcriptional regulator [Spirochaetales bacterium]|jgi:DNA-binding transcriptional ArsR family regulator|nr:helix-turn-helix domain-containing protein [Exilispira sp.]NMC67077.1 winged helix-turn-helix transcriptional regulator [Spirochaetales bacterium]